MAAETSRQAPPAGQLYPKGNEQAGVKFQLNPESISRRRAPQYAEIGAAAADYWSDYSGPSPLQWVRNPPEMISFELLFFATGDDNVEHYLSALRKMMSKSPTSPRGQSPGPSDLIFSYGKRSDTVRIVSLGINEILHNSKLEVQQARVQVELKTVAIGRK